MASSLSLEALEVGELFQKMTRMIKLLLLLLLVVVEGSEVKRDNLEGVSHEKCLGC